MIKAILFDLDDTLFDHRGSSRTALNQLKNSHLCFSNVSLDEIERHHLKMLEEIHINKVLTGLITVPEARRERIRSLFKLANFEIDETQLEKYAAFYKSCYENSWQAVPGSIELLRELKKKYKIGVISNNLMEEQKRKVLRCGFTGLIDELVVSDEYKINKPDKRLFKILLDKLGVKAEEAILIGDAWEADIIGAANARIKTIWFNRFNLPCPDKTICKEITSFIPIEDVVKVIEEL
ncbi:MAG: HAD family hydrolase [Ignavibacteriae bacterium]|nr:MAG: HAD family hydrolase [Ignavibacteriota bacterium]